MKRIFFVYIIAMSVLTFACEKEIPFRANDSRTQVVVNGFNTPDSTFRLHLSQSLPITANNSIVPPNITQAIVKLYNAQNQLITKLNHQSEGVYISETNTYPIQGQRYHLTVETLGFPLIKAQDIIPKVSESFEATVDSREIDGHFGRETTVLFILKFKDIPQEENFYIISVDKVVTNGSVLDFEPISISSDDVNIDAVEDSEGFSREKTLFMKDNAFDGRNYTLKFNHFTSFVSPSTKYRISLKTCSEAYYQYLRSITQNELNKYDPFAQPIQIFSNIENGIGIFGGYVEKTKEVTLGE